MNICSFWAPRPEHPFFQDYQPYLRLLDESCRCFGHRHIVLTDDAAQCADCDTHQSELPRSLMKAYLAALVAYLEDKQFADTPTLLTGADCALANDPIVMAHDADLVITTDDRFLDCRMNCGAIYVRRPADVAHVFRDALERCGDEWGDDQRAIYGAIKASNLTVHELPCDPYNLAPDNPGDDCSRGIVLHFRGPRKRWMVDYCHTHLGIGEGVVMKLAPSMTENEMLDHVLINAALAFPWVEAVPAHDGHAVLVGGGPSLEADLPEVRWRMAQGQTIFGLNGAAAFLIKHGIAVDHGVILDPRKDNIKFLTPLCKEWLIASQCHPDVVQEASKGKMRLWHWAADGVEDFIPKAKPAFLIGGGLTVGLTAMCLAFAMGYRHLHLYGYDSSNAENAAHAYTQSETAPEARYMTVWCGGREFQCGPGMYAQANAFPDVANGLAEAGALITVHGDGLLPTRARSMQSATLLEQAA